MIALVFLTVISSAAATAFACQLVIEREGALKREKQFRSETLDRDLEIGSLKARIQELRKRLDKIAGLALEIPKQSHDDDEDEDEDADDHDAESLINAGMPSYAYRKST